MLKMPSFTSKLRTNVVVLLIRNVLLQIVRSAVVGVVSRIKAHISRPIVAVNDGRGAVKVILAIGRQPLTGKLHIDGGGCLAIVVLGDIRFLVEVAVRGDAVPVERHHQARRRHRHGRRAGQVHQLVGLKFELLS